jgi:hypothetical protein
VRLTWPCAGLPMPRDRLVNRPADKPYLGPCRGPGPAPASPVPIFRPGGGIWGLLSAKPQPAPRPRRAPEETISASRCPPQVPAGPDR